MEQNRKIADGQKQQCGDCREMGICRDGEGMGG